MAPCANWVVNLILNADHTRPGDGRLSAQKRHARTYIDATRNAWGDTREHGPAKRARNNTT
eukprot:122349-Lingulodinium_polyedra.AAC.1